MSQSGYLVIADITGYTAFLSESEFKHEKFLPLEPSVLWDYLTRPEYRTAFYGSDEQKIVERKGARNGSGTVYECYHGGQLLRNTVVDWHPFEQITTYETTPIPRVTGYATYMLEPVEGGTRLTYALSKSDGPLLMKILCDLGAPRYMRNHVPEYLKSFRQLIVEDLAGREVAEGTELAAGTIEKAVVKSLAGV